MVRRNIDARVMQIRREIAAACLEGGRAERATAQWAGLTLWRTAVRYGCAGAVSSSAAGIWWARRLGPRPRAFFRPALQALGHTGPPWDRLQGILFAHALSKPIFWADWPIWPCR